MTKDDAARAISEVAGSKDVVLVPFDQHFGAGQSGVQGQAVRKIAR